MRKKILISFMLGLSFALSYSKQAEADRYHFKVGEYIDVAPDRSEAEGGYPASLRDPINLKGDGLNEPATIYSQKMVFNAPIKISSVDPNKRAKVSFTDLTISKTNSVVFENLDISGKIQIEDGANVDFINCKIEDTVFNDFVVRISGGSSAYFEDCSLEGLKGATVSVSDYNTKATFYNCSIQNEDNIGILINNSASADAIDCDFIKCEKEGMHLEKSSIATVYNCKFHDMNGRAIVAIQQSKVDISQSNFKNCEKGAVAVAGDSEIKVDKSEFENLNNTAIFSKDKSVAFVSRCQFKDIDGNGVNFKDSNGEVNDASFDSIAHPAVAVLGSDATPTIHNCTIKNVVNPEAAIIAVRQGSSPQFYNIEIDGYTPGQRVISCSDSSTPDFGRLEFKDTTVCPVFEILSDAKPGFSTVKDWSMVYFKKDGSVEKYYSEDEESAINPIIIKERV